MNILSLENVSKTFGIKPLFSSVSFGLDESDKIGVIGANGSGKSTLLKVIGGEEQSDTGRVVIANGKVIGYLSQNRRLIRSKPSSKPSLPEVTKRCIKSWSCCGNMK